MTLVIAVLVSALGSTPAVAVVLSQVEAVRYRPGDALGWAQPAAAEHSDWGPERPRQPGLWWIGTRVQVLESAPAGADAALWVLAPGALEIYWDGQLIGGSGSVGADAASERPGRHGVWAALDPSLVTPGSHWVAVRLSTFHAPRIRGPIQIALRGRAKTERVEGIRTALFLLCAGALLVAGLVFALLQRSTGRRGDTAALAILTSLVGTLLLLEVTKFVVDYPYPWHFRRLVAISCNTILVGVLLPLFLSLHLRVARPLWLALGLGSAYVGLAIGFHDPDFHSLYILRVALVVSFGLAVWGVYRARPGARWILLAITANLMPIFFTGFRYADHWFFLGFLTVVGVLLVRMANTLRRQATEREEALRTAERLQHELLRKSIQPHFLMNTLAVAISHIEEDPARGIGVLRDLSQELEAFFAISEHSVVPLNLELELCRRHVVTMGHLLDQPLRLELTGTAVDVAIPPGVLLTLVENSLTHGRLVDAPHIGLRVDQDESLIRFEVSNAVSSPESGSPEGRGLRYVRAQLQRAFGDRWRLSGHHDRDRWTATIEILAR